MSEALIVRRGGTGGMPLSNAIIHAKAPYGSTVTFSKGGVVVKTIGPDKAHPNSDGEYADYYLSVSTSNYGSWTMTATRGDYSSTSGTVTVDTNDQYDVLLRFIQYLFEDGDQCTAVTGGWKSVGALIYDDSIVFAYTGSAGHRAAFTKNKVALGGHTKLNLKCTLTQNFSGYPLHFGLSSQNTNAAAPNILNDPVNFTNADVGIEKTKIVDISRYKDSEYYIGLDNIGSGIIVTKVWLDW